MKIRRQIITCIITFLTVTSSGAISKEKANDLDLPTPAIGGNSAALMERGQNELAHKDYEKAIKTFKELSLMQPSDSEVMLKIALAYNQLGNLDEAINWARKAVAIDPKNASNHETLGQFLEANHDTAGAVLQYDRAMDLSQTVEDRSRLYIPLLRALVSNDELEKAIKLAKRWVDGDSKNAADHYDYAWVLAQSKNEKIATRALDEYDKALSLDPSLNQANYNSALLLIRFNQKKEAKEHLEAFLKSTNDAADQKSAHDLLNKLGQN
jgi:tetratricopeptide (TPR) repeat protein